jgi:hypothetical protein
MLNAEEFKNRLEIYSGIDYDDDFNKFWKWKLETENETAHILDYVHRDETHRKLCEMAGKWQVYRHTKNKDWKKTLKDSLERMADAYNQIRRYSLISFNEVPQKPLELIWHELGRVKEENWNKNRDGNYYTVAITKPLMFLWGHTLAFDSNVRKSMPLFDIPQMVLNDYKWNFETWSKVVKGFSDFLKESSAIIDLSKKKSIEKYGTDYRVPYGRFLDMYYWIGGSPYEVIMKQKDLYLKKVRP